MRIFLLLFIVAISCQQKKRGVVCQRVDAQSGQCSPELLSETNKDSSTDDLTALFDKPNKINEDKEVDETMTDTITDETLLKDIIIESKCVDGECLTTITCRVLDCGENNLLPFTDDNQSHSTSLCEEGHSAVRVSGTTPYKDLTCGFLIGGQFDEDKDTHIMMTSDLLNEGACLAYNVIGNGTSPVIGIPRNKCPNPFKDGNNANLKVIELTFSLAKKP